MYGMVREGGLRYRIHFQCMGWEGGVYGIGYTSSVWDGKGVYGMTG